MKNKIKYLGVIEGYHSFELIEPAVHNKFFALPDNTSLNDGQMIREADRVFDRAILNERVK